MIEIAYKSQDKLCKDPAWLYCATCTHDNKYDWRLPTDHELNTNDLLICNFQFIWAEDDMAGYVLYVVPVRDKLIEHAPVSSRELSIEEAFLYTITCTHNNKYDWRFPTTNEVESKAYWRLPNDANKDNWTRFYWNWYNSSYYPCIPVRDL